MTRLTRLSITIAILWAFMSGAARTPSARATVLDAKGQVHTITVAKGQRVTVTAKPRTKVVVRVKPGAGVDIVNISMRGDVRYSSGDHGIVNVDPTTWSYFHQVCAKVGPCTCPEGQWLDGQLEEPVGLGDFTLTLQGKKSGAKAVLKGLSLDQQCTTHDPCLVGTWSVTDMSGMAQFAEEQGGSVVVTSGTRTLTFSKNGSALEDANNHTIVLTSSTGQHATILANGRTTAQWETPSRGTLSPARPVELPITTGSLG